MALSYMPHMRITQSRNEDTQWTELSVRRCNTTDGPKVEMHIEHFLHRYDRKSGRSHLNYPVLTVEEAKQLRDMLSAAISDAEAAA